MDTGSNKGHLKSSTSPPRAPENDWEDIIETGSPLLTKKRYRLPRHRLLSYTCCLGKQRRGVHPYFCNPIVSKVSTEEDLQTLKNTVFNSIPLYSGHIISLSTENNLMEVIPGEPGNLTLVPSASPKTAEQSRGFVKKVSFNERKVIFSYNSYESRKPQLEPDRYKANLDSYEYDGLVDITDAPLVL